MDTILRPTHITRIGIDRYMRWAESVIYYKDYVTFMHNGKYGNSVNIDPYLKDFLSIYMYIEQLESVVYHRIGNNIEITIVTN